MFRFVGFSFYFSIFSELVLVLDEIRVVRWGDGGEENSDSGYGEARGGSEISERAGYFSSPQKVS